MQRVISELFGEYFGRPILVIGGGPSTSHDLPTLPADFRPALVLSANEHGCKQDRFTVDYIVNCDKTHCMRHVPMEGYLRQFGRPIINRWSWADVRLEDWTFEGNSGTTAIAIAAALGGSPIVALGIDFWATGRTYFWENGADIPAIKRYAWQRVPVAASRPDKRLSRLGAFAGDAHIRALSGILTTRWPKYRPGELLGAPPLPAYTKRVFGAAPYRVVKGFRFGNNDIVRGGTVLQLTEREANIYLREGKLAKVAQGD